MAASKCVCCGAEIAQWGVRIIIIVVVDVVVVATATGGGGDAAAAASCAERSLGGTFRSVRTPCAVIVAIVRR